MKTNHTKKIIMLALLCGIVLPGCQSLTSTENAASSTTSTPAAATAAANTAAPAALTPVTYSQADEYSDWKTENPVYIELSAAGANIQGSGAQGKDRTVTITAAGTYVLSGQWEQGQVVVEAPKEEKVRIVLNGVEIHSKEGSALYVKQADKVFVSLPEGTKNVLTDAAEYKAVDAATSEPNAALFSKEDLTLNGTGELTVRGNYNNGITSKDDLKITGGRISVYAADDGIQGKDVVGVKQGTLTIEAKGDGIKATNDTDAAKGLVSIDAGTFTIKAGRDGIQAVTSVLVAGGTFNISSGGGSASAPVKTGDNGGGMRGPGAAAPAPAATTTAAAETESGKAIKAGTDLLIAGGSFQIDSADDAIHSNKAVTIAGGDLTITSGDDGIHADASILISGGKTNVTKSYEGIESGAITIAGGETKVTTTDDGINVSGGADGSATNRPGENSFSASSSKLLTITGGTLYVDSTGDGLDSNGSIVMSGGNVYVNGPTENNNGALDYDGTFEYSGGLLIAAGSSGMMQSPSDTSTQHSILMTYSQTQKAGTVVELKDNAGKIIASFTPAKSFQAIAIGAPELKKDSSYVLYTNGAKTVEFTAAGATTWLNESGVTTARKGGPGGGGGFGGGNRGMRP
jgi:hypothetical protein